MTINISGALSGFTSYNFYANIHFPGAFSGYRVIASKVSCRTQNYSYRIKIEGDVKREIGRGSDPGRVSENQKKTSRERL